MSKDDQHIRAAARDNTRQRYQFAIRHFEVEWRGFLPATADSIARYLADHAKTLSINTLRQRLAALAQWHIDQGFPDPTKAYRAQGVPRHPGPALRSGKTRQPVSARATGSSRPLA
jgi:hypothetical protein